VSKGLNSPEWYEALARLVADGDGMEQADALINVVSYAAQDEGTCLLAFHRDAPPEILHHTINPEDARHYLDRYIAGPYLLDPLYQLAMKPNKPLMCRFRDAQPDRFRSSEYYHQYCERTHLVDEMDFVLGVSDTTTVVLVVARRARMFSKAELQRLQLISSIVSNAMRNIWNRWSARGDAAPRDRALHHRLTTEFENFGEGVLTARERQITQLLLRGHSSKSVARELDIAPGTVMVHKRNLFSKLGITSQYELFSLFISNLSRY
jgi:DNA-binding CsgD family transcriptional regulator